MTPIAPDPPLDSTSVLCLLLILLIPLTAAGLAFINTGLGRSRNAAHMMLASLSVMGVAAIAYFMVGFSWQGYAGGPAHALQVAGKPLDWIATVPFFLRGLPLNGSRASLTVLFGLFSAALAAVIPLGSGADRWRLGSACISSALLAGFTYPLFAHWAWNGWLAQLGSGGGIGQGYLDAGGAGPIQVLGGLTALALTWVLGPRRGKYTPDRMPLAIPGHNAVFVLFGCFLAWIGWIGLDGAGTILFTSAGEGGTVVLVAINATLAAAGAALIAALVTRTRYGKPDASLCANGWIAGLVASSAGCAYFRPLASLIVGVLAGALVTYAVEMLELHFTIDDPGGTVSVHALGGMWGILAAGWFTTLPEPTPPSSQWIAQVAAIATLLGFVLPLNYGMFRLLNRLRPLRVPPDGERKGLDLHELGAGAYPDFVSHNDDLLQR